MLRLRHDVYRRGIEAHALQKLFLARRAGKPMTARTCKIAGCGRPARDRTDRQALRPCRIDGCPKPAGVPEAVRGTLQGRPFLI